MLKLGNPLPDLSAASVVFVVVAVVKEPHSATAVIVASALLAS